MAFNPLNPVWTRQEGAGLVGDAALEGDELVAATGLGSLRASLHPFGARLRFGPERANAYDLIRGDVTPAPASLALTDGRLRLESADFVLTLETSTLAFTLARRDGRVVQRSARDGHFARPLRLPPFARTEEGWLVHLDLASREHVYGLGEKWGPLDKRGQLIRSYNIDALGVNAEASYKNAPFAWCPRPHLSPNRVNGTDASPRPDAASVGGWGVFCHTPAPVTHGVGFPPWSKRAYGLLVEDETLDLFVFAGDDGAALIGAYTALTGRAPVPPDWSLGVILSKAYYRDADELLATAREVRARGAPCDTITLDGRAWQDTDTRFAFEWDKSRYPDPGAVIAELKALNFKVCVWEYPLISVRNPLFQEFADKGWLLKDRATGEAYRYEWELEPFNDVLTPLPASGLVDFTHPDAFAWWRDRHKALFDIGVDMIKADFGEQVTDDMIAHNGEAGRALHNVYALLYNRCVYEAAVESAKNGPFLFSRSSWTGGQNYPGHWGGDPQADWEGLAGSLRGGLSWGMSGGPYYATDVGGFYGDERDPKLYVRWLQASVFSSHLRLHGIGPREPWTYGPEAEAAAMAALQLRYRLLPYLRGIVAEAAETGLPVQRPMALAYPHEPQSWTFEHQFLFGPDLLVAPCLDPDDHVAIYLPRDASGGAWRRFPDGAPFEAGHAHGLKLRLDEMAVFVRPGASIPLGPDIEFTEQNKGLETVERIWQAP